MNELCGSHYLLHLFTNTTNCAISCEWKLVFCSVLWRVYVERIYSSIPKNSRFDWSIQVTWKRKVIGKSDSFKQTILV